MTNEASTPAAAPQYVYLARSGDAWKIGWSQEPARRTKRALVSMALEQYLSQRGFWPPAQQAALQ